MEKETRRVREAGYETEGTGEMERERPWREKHAGTCRQR